MDSALSRDNGIPLLTRTWISGLYDIQDTIFYCLFGEGQKWQAMPVMATPKRCVTSVIDHTRLYNIVVLD